MRPRRYAYLLYVTLVCCAFALAGPWSAQAQQSAVAVTPESVATEGGLRLDPGCLYHAGDDESWARRDLDDSAWERLADASISEGKIPQSGWTGICWFRLHLDVDARMVNVPLAVGLWHRGASELYLDGAEIARFGRVAAVSGGPSGEVPYNSYSEPTVVTFASPGVHVLAIRYSSAETPSADRGLGHWLIAGTRSLGVYASMKPAREAISSWQTERTKHATREYAQGGLIFAFGLIHLFLFAFYPRERANLYYSLLALSASANLGLRYILENTSVDPLTTYWMSLCVLGSVGLILTFLLAFLAASFEPRARALPWIFFALWCVLQVGCLAIPWLVPIGAALYWPLVGLGSATSLAILGRAVARGEDGAWIVGIGVVAVVLVFVRDFFKSIVPLPGDTEFLIGAGSLAAFVATGSCFLARRFARTHDALAAQLEAVRELSARELEHERREAELSLAREQERAQLALVEAENARRARELDEAREVQLSMLPRELPALAHLDIATFMSTASEVGGDYYDFHLSADGVLTVAVGDATGHGLKAGTVVTATKSLFCAAGGAEDIRATFREFTRTLKGMRLGRLYMALTIAKFRGTTMTISAAGMPPALLYRAATGQVEQILLKGMPLGAFVDFRYEERDLALGVGDVVLLMSDGLPELFDEQREMFDYERAIETFRAASSGTAQDVVDALCRAAEAWSGARPQDDDITYVVVKIRATPERADA